MMQGAHDFLSWLRANPAAAVFLVYVLTGVLNAAFKPRNPDEYAKMNRYLAGFLKALSALGLDPVKLVEALVMLLKLPAPGDGGQPAPMHITQNFQDSDPDHVAQVMRDSMAEMSKPKANPGDGK